MTELNDDQLTYLRLLWIVAKHHAPTIIEKPQTMNQSDWEMLKNILQFDSDIETIVTNMYTTLINLEKK